MVQSPTLIQDDPDLTAEELHARLKPTIAIAAKANRMSEAYLTSILQQESGFSPDVAFGRRVSSAGAQGVAQFMPATAAGFNLNPLDPEASVHAAALFLRQNLTRYGEDGLLAAAAYNAGPGAVDRIINANKGKDVTASQLVAQLPGETQDYVVAISDHFKRFSPGNRLTSVLIEESTEGGTGFLNATARFVDTFVPGGRSDTTFSVPSIPGVSQGLNVGFDAASGVATDAITNPLKTISTIGGFLAFITDPQNLARVALTGAAVGMIAMGIIVFVFARPGGRKAVTTATGAAVGGPAGAAAGAAAGGE